jgi:hypothetical protein
MKHGNTDQQNQQIPDTGTLKHNSQIERKNQQNTPRNIALRFLW